MGRESISNLQNQFPKIVSETQFSETQQALIRSLIFLWHDHLDESHSISQEIQARTEVSCTASCIGANRIMVTRDIGFIGSATMGKRFSTIASRATEVLEIMNARAFKTQLLPNDDWDAFAFTDACEAALRKKDEAAIPVLEQIQEIEFKTLLEHFLR